MASFPEGERDKRLDEIYYNPYDPGSYGGVQRLLKRAREKGIEGINVKVIQAYLTYQQAYSLHKPARKTLNVIRPLLVRSISNGKLTYVKCRRSRGRTMDSNTF